MSAAEINIIDVIHHYSAYGLQVFVVLDRMPEFIYERTGDDLVAHDDGFYDFMYLQQPWGGFKAFGGREFDIKLTNGTTLHCNGQVWHGRAASMAPCPRIDVGIGTPEGLRECNVFSSAGMSEAKYEAWMAVNKPSHDYEKYSRMRDIGYWDEMYRDNPRYNKPVSPKRARKLRQRGVTIRRCPETNRPMWSPNFERHKQEIKTCSSPDYKGRFHPDNKKVLA